MTEGLSRFRSDMGKVVQIAKSTHISSKAQRYLRAYEVGLPQDITVRWFPKDALGAIKARVEDLTNQGLEVWISQGLPWNPDIDSQLTSVERRTDLIKGIHSLKDFHERVVPILAGWEPGSWAKIFYDTPQRSLIGGTIRIDTNRTGDIQGVDMRSLRFEAASGTSDVRDLDRQMSARQIVVVHPDPEIINQIKTALKPLESIIIGISDGNDALDSILTVVDLHKPQDDPKAKTREPKAILLDMENLQSFSKEIIQELKGGNDTSGIPIIPICKDEASLTPKLRSLISSYIPLPIIAESIRLSVFMTGFRLTGGPQGFRFPDLDLSIQREIERLLSTVFGPGGAYRRMMVQIANAEQRPTIAFEFKLVPADPYDFFFLDYEWSGPKSPLHRFDWLYNFGDGG